MTTSQKNQFEVTQKSPYPLDDFQDSATRDSSCEKIRHPQPQTMRNSEVCSFNVPWQLPKIKNRDFDKNTVRIKD